MREVTARELIERYDGFLLDAYGVLVDSHATLAGGNEFLTELRSLKKPFCIISNDGSTTPQAKAARWEKRGLKIEPEQLLTPWSVLAAKLGPLKAAGKSGFVIGTELSEEMLRRAGGRVSRGDEIPEVIYLADEQAEPFMEKCDRALSLALRSEREKGKLPELALLNPDLVYPAENGYGFTAGAIALMFEGGLERLTGRPCRFTQVGKPGPEIFELGLEYLGIPKERVVMIGDQWETDIRGARAAGLDSVLATTGLGHPDSRFPDQMILCGFPDSR